MLDTGSCYVRAGFAGEEAPRVQFPNIIGTPKMVGIINGIDQKEFYFGYEALSRKAMLKTDQPFDRGLIRDWDSMERIWNYAIVHELKTQAEEHPIMITEAPNCPKQHKERLTQYMFESQNVSCLYISVQAVLSLYASGRTSGLIVDSGDQCTFTVPIHEG